MSAATLDHHGIAARIPHAGRMCLLDGLLGWSADEIRCRATDHQAADHPLRTAEGLLAPCAVEFASQAMALHAALAAGDGAPARAGFLASVRGLRLYRRRLDDAPGPFEVSAFRLAGDARQASYRFALHDGAGRPLAEGRAAVVLDAGAWA